jgi:prepilin-type N-terminal cleavage/methylation domain-containing protein
MRWPSVFSNRRTRSGFTLTELAIVLVIIGFLLGSLMYTLSAQTEQRARDETARRLAEARELLVSFAIVTGRLPCPGSATSNGLESDSPAGSGNCTNYYTGYLPAKAIGFQPQNASGYALDGWGNPIRYAVSQNAPVNSATPVICRRPNPAPPPTTLPPLTPHFTHKDNLKTNGVDCAPSDIVVCASATGIITSPASCNSATAVTNQNIVAAVIWSQGKNYATASFSGVMGQAGSDEAANNKTSANNHAVFVSHPPAPAGAPNGEFDDYLVWITVGELYGRLIAAGVLP